MRTFADHFLEIVRINGFEDVTEATRRADLHTLHQMYTLAAIRYAAAAVDEALNNAVEEAHIVGEWQRGKLTGFHLDEESIRECTRPKLQ